VSRESKVLCGGGLDVLEECQAEVESIGSWIIISETLRSSG
jgi:hypothetical protein